MIYATVSLLTLRFERAKTTLASGFRTPERLLHQIEEPLWLETSWFFIRKNLCA